MKTLLLIFILAINIFAQYDEPYRPQTHFSPPANWMNDPNGMVYANGEYHLFYQYYPNDTVWGPMHWGHAVSRDLIHWENLPIALYPDELGYIFSGSAVFDKENTSGFGTKKDPPLVAMYTYHDPKGAEAGRTDYQYQGLAYSTDNGRTWTKYDKNPVIPNSEKLKDFRDTKVFWNEKLKSWSVVLAVGDHIRFYSSPDLKNWTMTGEFGKSDGSHAGVWECPDLFPLKVDGKTKWVLLLSINPGGLYGGSGTQYFIGDFDGKTFTNDNPPETVLWLDHGRDNYAGVTWANAPKNRRIFLGWMSNWEYAQKVPTEKWRSAMTWPRELSLRRTEKGIRLIQIPVKETEKLRDGQFLGPKNQTVEKSLSIGDGKSPLVEMDLEIDLAQTTAEDFGVELSNSRGESYRIGFDKAVNKFYSDRTDSGKHNFSEEFGQNKPTAERLSTGKILKIHLVFDAASVEMFADDGEVAMTEIFFPSEDFTNFKIYSTGGKTVFSNARAWYLKSIWPPPPPVPDDDPVRVFEVRLPVTVTEKKKKSNLVTGLEMSDFAVFEDGVRQEMTFFTDEKTNPPVYVGVLMDTSASTAGKLRFSREAAKNFIYTVTRLRKDKAAFMTFDHQVILRQDFTDKLDLLDRAVEQVGEVGSQTALYDAVWQFADEKLRNAPGRRVIVIITDGDDTFSRAGLDDAIDMAQRTETTIFAISTRAGFLGSVPGVEAGQVRDRGDNHLARLCEETGGQVFFTGDMLELETAFTRISKELSGQYMITYRPANQNYNGQERRIEVRFTNKDLEDKYDIRTRESYRAIRDNLR